MTDIVASDLADLERWARAVQMVSFDGPVAPPWLLDELAAGTGSVCLFAGNVESDEAVAELVAALRSARPDVVVAIDEEGGDVTRLDQRRGSDVPGPAVLGAVDDLEATAAAYRMIGRRLARAGIDLDLAPVADVNVAAENPVIGVRSFGDDAGLVARHVAAAAAALESVGVAACLKHFPGHGATVDDSHQGLPVLDVDAATLRARELVPFAGSSAAAVMTAHMVVTALDAQPATRSRVVLGVLRDELGFDGVIVSDALDMAGVHGPAVRYGEVTPDMIGVAAVAAIDAGCDLLCLGARQGHDVPLAVTSALVRAVADGRLSGARLADAAARVGSLCRASRARHVIEAAADPDADEAIVASVAARAVAVAGDLRVPVRSALVVDCRAEASMATHGVLWGLGPVIAAADPTARHRDATPSTTAEEIAADADNRPLVVVVRSAGAHRWQLDLLERLALARPDLVTVEVGWPARAAVYAGAALVTSFGASRTSIGAVASRLLATA
ncbi:glycoside hydrolase family 3 protein [Desertimonas flava]|uniref:glycoside hydrolase family 3 protein n=1 Tax=Desertimonas flava TaxID=2064846 RepID=UPI0013C4EFD2|nr:glycoside hydrolase family 3 protein [Desertimonas flava]